MYRVPALGFVLAVLFAAPLAAEPHRVTGADGRSVAIGDASRIVAVGGTVTEILYALGLGERIVGVDLTSDYPAEAMEKPKVGYMRQLAAEGVLALGPTLIIAIEDAGPPETLAVLADASVPFVMVPKAHDPAGVAASIAGRDARLEKCAAAAVEADLATVEVAFERIGERRKAVFALGGAARRCAGSGTRRQTCSRCPMSTTP
jgi:iron complex transport system substrate-binding protein